MSTMQEASDLSKLKEAAGDDAALDTLSLVARRPARFIEGGICACVCKCDSESGSFRNVHHGLPKGVELGG